MPWLALLLLGIAAALLGRQVGRRAAGAPSGPASVLFTYPSFATDRAVTNAPVGPDGFVRAEPRALAAQAGVGVETYTLARFLGSEWASGSAIEKAAIAWSIVNKARQRGWTILRMATTVVYGPRGDKTVWDSGLYGRQDMQAWRPGANRYAATARDPTGKDLYVASMVLGGAWPDVTRGGDQFFDPRTQARLHERDPETFDAPADVIARWTHDGRQVRSIPGTDASRLLVIGPRLAA